MPRTAGGGFQGNYGNYAGSGLDDGGGGSGAPSDEDAITDAVDRMFSACGNAGQESIIGNGAAIFETWAIKTLEGIGNADGNYPQYIETLVGVIGYSAWFGTQEIWDEGYSAMSEQSQFHDGKPDVGKVGVEF